MEKSYVSRVNQLDAYLLDKEITKVIHEQLTNVYKELPPGLLSRFQPEIDCCLKSIVWLCSIQRNKSTFGQQILAITYQANELTRNKQILHYLLTICAPYARDVSHLRLTNHLLLQKTISWIECCLRVFTVLNFFRFLKAGVYPSLVDYCLRFRHVSKSGTRMRNVGYAYMNRELIWTGFLVSSFNRSSIDLSQSNVLLQELLNVTIPLINLHAVKRRIVGVLKPRVDQHLRQRQQPLMGIDTKCAICSQRPSLPHHINCQHVFCYFCLKSNVLADPQFQCPVCDFPGSGDIFPLQIKL